MTGSVPQRWAAWAWTGAAALWLTLGSRRPWDTVVDDAYISARYAEQLAAGHGLVYNADGAAVEGITNLLWTLTLAAGRLVGLPMHGLLTWLGWLCALAALAGLTALSRGLSDRDDALHALPAWVFACLPHLWVASTNGLESTMMVALVVGTLAAHVHRAPRLTPLFAAALILCRPEGAAVVALVVGHALWRDRASVRSVWPLAATAVSTLLLLTAFRLATYGAWLPNTFSAKASFPLLETFQHNQRYLSPRAWTLGGHAVILGLASLLPPYRSDRALVAVTAVTLGLIPLSVDLWMPGLRLFLPAIALTGVLVATSLMQLPPRAAWLGALGVCGLSLWHAHDTEAYAMRYDRQHSALPDNGAMRAGQHLAAHLPSGSWLAIRDAGVLAYYAGVDVNVAELHHRALTLPHPDGDNVRVLETTPVAPAAVVVTLRDAKQRVITYPGDRQVLQRLPVPYDYLGRVYQHPRRHYDLYVHPDLGVPQLPADIVVNRIGTPGRDR